MDRVNEGEVEPAAVEHQEPVVERMQQSSAPQETALAGLIASIDKESSIEGKIRLGLDFMQGALSSGSSPRFKDFWEGKKLCLPLFKQQVAPKMRSQLWSAYIELSNEAKKLKEILDEQSAFAVEQIELAILGVERDLENYELALSNIPALFLEVESCVLKDKREVYERLQLELTLLNSLASKVNGMRKEVIRTEMRIRIKNKLLDRLSVCGDKIFPKRKEFIQEVSTIFTKDISEFVTMHFGEEKLLPQVPLYVLREEIKQLQMIAKILTLNTRTFNETRLLLSRAWDQLKEFERERKKQELLKNQLYKQDREERQEQRRVRMELVEREKQAQEEEAAKFKQEELLRRKEIEQLKEDLQSLLTEAGSLEVDLLSEKRDLLLQKFAKTSLNKAEKQMIDRYFKQLKDLIDEKKEKALLLLSEEDLKALQLLNDLLEERKKRRAEIKQQLEQYRKQLGGSGFDFEKAMQLQELIGMEKAALEKINASIGEIEDKINEIEE